MGAKRLGFLLLAAAGALGACHRTPAAVETAQAPIAAPPEAQRAPGLWRQRVISDDGVQVLSLCLDAATEAKLAAFGRQVNATRCSRRAMAETDDGAWRFDTTCDMGDAGVVTTIGTATGDFTRHYRIQAESVVTGARTAALNGRRRLVADFSLVGPCPAAFKGGDMITPGGKRLKALDLAAPADVR